MGGDKATFPCNYCEHVSHSKASMKKHSISHSSDVQTCFDCNKQFATCKGLVFHNAKTHKASIRTEVIAKGSEADLKVFEDGSPLVKTDDVHSKGELECQLMPKLLPSSTTSQLRAALVKKKHLSNPISRLVESGQACQKWITFRYLNTSGGEFVCEVTCGELGVKGTGNKKREARMKAAKTMIEQVENVERVQNAVVNVVQNSVEDIVTDTNNASESKDIWSACLALLTGEDKDWRKSTSSDVLRSVICTSPVSTCLGTGFSSVSVQAGLVVADTSCSQAAVCFLEKEQLVTFKDSRTAAQFLGENDGVGRCLVDHYLALQEDVFGLGAVEIGGSVRVRTVKEINDKFSEVGKTNTILEANAVCATRILLEVTHDMLIDLASDMLEEATIGEVETCESLPVSPISPSSLSVISSHSLSFSGSGCLDTDSDEEDWPERDGIPLDKLLQVKQSILSQIVELTRKMENSPPIAYKRRNSDLEQLEQLELVSSEEGEWTPVHNESKRSRIDQTCMSKKKKQFLAETVIVKETLDEVSSDDNLDDFIQRENIQSDVKRKKRKNKSVTEIIEVDETLDGVSSDDNFDDLIQKTPLRIENIKSKVMTENSTDCN